MQQLRLERERLSRESGREKTKCDRIAPRTHSDGPVSQTCLLRLLRRELLRAVTLDDSTPQRRISELRVWSYEPFIVFAPSSSGYTSGQNLEVLYCNKFETYKSPFYKYSLRENTTSGSQLSVLLCIFIYLPRGSFILYLFNFIFHVDLRF